MGDQSTIIPGNGHRDRFNRRHLVAAIGLIAAVAVVGCGSASAPAGSAGSPSTASNDNSAATAVARVSTGMNGLAGAAQQVNNLTVVKMTQQSTFDPVSIAIPPGSTVTWTNDGTTPRSATFDPAKATTKSDVALPTGVQPFDSGLVQPGQSWSHVFTTPGTYRYVGLPTESGSVAGTIVVA